MLQGLIFAITRFFAFFVPVDKKRITVLFFGYSGSNLTPVIKSLKTNQKYQEWKTEIVYEGDWSKEGVTTKNSSGIGRIRFFFHKFWTIARSRLVLTTHGVHHLKTATIYFNLWHGIPLKALWLMDENRQGVKPDKTKWQDDYFLSTSTLFNTLMNACYGLQGAAYHVLGYPRNDYLFSSDGGALLYSILNTAAFEKVILFVPTYRDYETSDAGALPIKDFDEKRFDDFLRLHNYCLIIKRHREDKKNDINVGGLTNILSLSNDIFDELEIDFYEILNGVDLLITDYSSIFFDYLLLDRPLLFVPTDLELYEQKRGFLLSPYAFWTPGPKCDTQQTLEDEILKSLADTDYYRSERRTICNLLQTHQDGASTIRVMRLIEKIMDS
jgi:CDP-glycerol glycerophosphotransferase (TagB/SpsB family)